MIKILHSADWHLDSPLQGRTDAQADLLRKGLLELPDRIATICRQEQCDLVLLAGDLFDDTYSQSGYQALYRGLQEMGVPVFIAPGNHDPIGNNSPWLAERWPDNVHIFTRPVMEAVEVPQLGCRIYGAGFTGMDCDALLENFCAEDDGMVNLGVVHGDPVTHSSPCNPITTQQVRQSGLQYLALGHIHKAGEFAAGDTLCVWPGCPMGRGFDEPGEKGVRIVTVDNGVSTRFVPLDVPRFYDLEVEIEGNPQQALSEFLPPVGSLDFYRITLTGTSEPVDIAELTRQFERFPNLLLRDRTLPPADIWGSAGEDSLEGVYFQMLKQALENADEKMQQKIHLAATISRQILDGQEVKLP